MSMNKIIINIKNFGLMVVISIFATMTELMAQAATGVIDTTIQKMVTILNVLIVGIMAWSGFLLARGDSSAVQRIIYGIIGLVVVNSARVFLDFFM